MKKILISLSLVVSSAYLLNAETQAKKKYVFDELFTRYRTIDIDMKKDLVKILE